MKKYMPIINLDEIDINKIILKSSQASDFSLQQTKTYNVIHYNFNELYNNIPFRILIKNCNVAIDSNNNFLTNNVKLLELRNILDEMIFKVNNKENNLNKTHNSIFVKLNFNKYLSKAYLHPSKKSGKQTVLIKSQDEFIKTFKEYYPNYYSKNVFNNNIKVYADIIIQPYFLENNNFCSIAIYDADIGYDKIKKNIINNIIKQITYTNSEICL